MIPVDLLLIPQSTLFSVSFYSFIPCKNLSTTGITVLIGVKWLKKKFQKLFDLL